MIEHEVRTHPSAAWLARADQLAWKLAAVATDPVEVPADVTEMVINRVIDDAAVAAASLARRPVRAAREQALRHPAPPGAAVWGAAPRVADLPGVGRVGQRRGRARTGLPRHLPRRRVLPPRRQHPAAARGRPAHRPVRRGPGARHRRPPTKCRSTWSRASACTSTRSTTSRTWARRSPPGSARCSAWTPRRCTRRSARRCTARPQTRQSRKGEISSWKAYAPAFAGKAAIEAVDRAMRGQGSPSPIYEGEDGVIAWLLAGPEAVYTVPLPAPGEPKRAILETYTKEHSAEYQAQALIDLARRLRPRDTRTRPRSTRSSSTPATTPTT